MNFIDVLIIVVLFWGAFSGLRSGLIQSLLNLISWLIVLFIARKFLPNFSGLFSFLSQDPVVQNIFAFITIIVVGFVLVWAIGHVLHRIISALYLSPLNRLGGGLFGFIKSLLIVFVAIHFLTPWVQTSPKWQDSRMITLLSPFAPEISGATLNMAKRVINEFKQKEQSEVSD